MYAESPTTRPISICAGEYPARSYADVYQWCPWQGFDDLYRSGVDPNVGFFAPPGWLVWLLNSGEPIGAYNSRFEADFFDFVLTAQLGWPSVHPDRWVDLMAMAQYYGLPGKLEDAIKVAGSRVPKGSHAAMLKLCKPRPHWVRTRKGQPYFCTDQLLAENLDYNIIDVVSESVLAETIPALCANERRIWALTRDINAVGVPIDRDLAEAGYREHVARIENAARRLPKVTGIKDLRPTQVAKLKEWLAGEGFPITSLNKKEIQPRIDAGEFPPHVQEALEIRLSAGTAATVKYKAFCDRMAADGRIHNELRYYGAHTGRWTSDGVQSQNFSNKKMDVDEAIALIPGFVLGHIFLGDDLDKFLSTAVRLTIAAPEGYGLLDFDLASIEARTIAWMARDPQFLADFSSGVDPYKMFAARLFKVDYEAVTKAQRALGKVAVLGLGYGMGPARFQQTCIDWGVGDPGEEFSRETTYFFRNLYPCVPQFWRDLETAIRQEMDQGCGTQWDRYTFYYDRRKSILTIYLPNGRPLFYHRCGLDEEGSITYWGRDAAMGNRWGFVRSWGGKFAENIDQGLSRDLIAQIMLRLRHRFPFIDICLTVHDEVVLLAFLTLLQRHLSEIETEARKNPLWAEGIPIDLESIISTRFRKA